MTAKILGLIIIITLVAWGLVTGYMLDFIFLYPMFMAIMWILGGLYFYFHWERHAKGPDTAPEMTEQPFVSIIIPCYNEAGNLVEAIEAACTQNWPSFEVVAVNDGSSDGTGKMLDELTKRFPNLRVVHFAQNQGKSMALRMGALVSRSEYIVTLDGDAILHPNATAYLVRPMLKFPRVGAVTGNPRVRSRSTFIGKVQVGEFSSIIGLIKRAQRIYGQIFTVSGVIASYRRRAVHDSGYWDTRMITEDIDISWSMQMKHWQIQYEPHALCWILMPETIRGLWRQRVRWSQGGAEVFFKYLLKLGRWRNRRMWLLLVDFLLSTVWAYSYVISLILWAFGKYVEMPPELNVPTIFPPAFWGLVLATLNIIQFIVALIIESRYERKLLGILVWTIWYPLVFWALSMFTTLAGLPRALFKGKDARAAWGPSDRGFK